MPQQTDIMVKNTWFCTKHVLCQSVADVLGIIGCATFYCDGNISHKSFF